jgi:hypothetical protein
VYQLTRQQEDNDKHSLKQKWKRIKLVLEQNDCIREIRTINGQLERLAPQLPPTIRKFSKLSAVTTKHFRIRDFAVNLHDVFQDLRGCQCKAPHDANLQLPRIHSDADEKVEETSAQIRFEVLFSFDTCSRESRSTPWGWRGLEFEPLPEQLPEPMTQGAPQVINDTCSKEHNPPEKTRSTGRAILKKTFGGLFHSRAGNPADPVTSPSPTAVNPQKG